MIGNTEQLAQAVEQMGRKQSQALFGLVSRTCHFHAVRLSFGA